MVKSAKLHTSTPTTASLRLKPDGSCQGIRPVFRASGLPATTECRGGIGSAPTGWPITSTRPAPVERRAPRHHSSTAAASRLRARFCLLRALSGRSASRPATGRVTTLCQTGASSDSSGRSRARTSADRIGSPTIGPMPGLMSRTRPMARSGTTMSM